MAGIVRKVHTKTSFDFGPVDKFAPDLGIRRDATNGSEGEVPDALAFLDPDGEMHVFVFASDDARALLIAKLSGGIVVSGSIPHGEL